MNPLYLLGLSICFGSTFSFFLDRDGLFPTINGKKLFCNCSSNWFMAFSSSLHCFKLSDACSTKNAVLSVDLFLQSPRDMFTDFPLLSMSTIFPDVMLIFSPDKWTNIHNAQWMIDTLRGKTRQVLQWTPGSKIHCSNQKIISSKKSTLNSLIST